MMHGSAQPIKVGYLLFPTDHFYSFRSRSHIPCVYSDPLQRIALESEKCIPTYKALNTLYKGEIMVNTTEPKKSIKIENVVASTAIGAKLDLNQVITVFEGAEYNKERFPGVVYRTTSPKTAALIFGSGKIVCTGAKSIADVYTGLTKVFDKIREMGTQITDQPEIKIQNIVASANLGRVLNLNAVAIGLGLENIEYEPEQFPGLVYRMATPKVVMLLFGSGKIVITGGKKPEDAEAAVEKVVIELDGLGLL
jgi:transcription initiation factor TFIID TATA-box-binding protein